MKPAYGKLGEQMLTRKNDNGQSNSLSKLNEPRLDESLKDMRTLVGKSISDNNPLATDIEKIVNCYAKLLRRFNKIVSISDSYQSQLREFNLRLELMAHTDPLTGIYNRGYFVELLSAE
ncbi:MAG: GGDEF domain-containing protein, partial [Chlorobium sp.]|nr:GGDEF domain-containing protein [Chlorobium sp.]